MYKYIWVSDMASGFRWADSVIFDRLENDSLGAQTPVERGQPRLTPDNKFSSRDGQLAGIIISINLRVMLFPLLHTVLPMYIKVSK